MTHDDRTALEARIEHLQSVLVKVEHGFNEMLKLKDNHTDFLKHELANLPNTIHAKLRSNYNHPREAIEAIINVINYHLSQISLLPIQGFSLRNTILLVFMQ